MKKTLSFIYALCILIGFDLNAMKSVSVLPSEISFLSAEQQSYEGYEVTPEGAWCWFADPRALHYENEEGTINSTYIGYIDVHGNIKAMQYDFLTKRKNEVLIRSYFQPDDHNNPTFVVLPDERVMIFYSRHTDEPCFYYRVSQKPGDITTLGEEKVLKTANNTTYPSPFILSDDPDNIYLCWRGISWHPTIARLSVPDSDGDTDFNWGPYQIVQSSGARPYAKYMSNGKDKIYLSYTTGHPDNEYPNYLYFNYVDINTLQLKDINGKSLSTIKNGAFNVNKSESYANSYPNTIVDKTSTSRNWLWQTEQDSEGNPVIAMVQISNDKSSHDYYHVKWTGNGWRKSFLTNAGGHFHQTPGLELCYSGGMALDESDPNIVYCSAPVNGDNGKVYEILKFTVDNDGKVSEPEHITRNSKKNNARPYLIPGSKNSPLRLSWMNGDYYDWIVSSSRPKGYPTAIHCDYDFPKEDSGIEKGLVSNTVFSADGSNGNSPAIFADDTYVMIETPELKEFSVSVSPYIFNGSYAGTIFSSGNLSWNLDAETMKPYIKIDENKYYSTNLLGNSDVWQTKGRGTGGEWYTPTKFEYFNLTITYSDGVLRTYINGLADQYIETGALELKDVTLGGYKGWMEDCRIYDRALNQEEIKQLTETSLKYTLDNNFLNELGRLEISLPSSVWSDIVVPSKTVTGETITWTTSNNVFLSKAGIVRNPSTETVVTLKAKVSDFEKEFNITVYPRDIEKNKLLSYEFENEDILIKDGKTIVEDKSGNGNDLTVYGSAKIDGTLDLTSNTASGFSSNGYAVAPSGMLDGLRSYTVFMKVNPKNLNKAPRLFDFGSASSNSLFGRGRNLTTGIKYNGTSTQMVNASSQITIGKDSYVAYTFDAATKTSRIYLDGVQVASGSTFTYEPYQLYDLSADRRNYIGRTQWWDTSAANDNIDYCGTIDNFRMYNIALTQDEIKSLQELYTSVEDHKKDDVIEIESFIVTNEIKIILDERYKSSTVQLSSLNGQIVAKAESTSAKVTLPIDLNQGIYILNIINNGKNIAAKKIIVQ